MPRVPLSLFISLLGVSVLLAPGLTLSGCTAFKRQPSPVEASAPLLAGVGQASVSEARDLAAKGVPVLDVREPHEFAAGHVPGARNLPLGQLEAWSTQLDPAGSYLLVCRSGRRSQKAMEALEAQGFKNLRNVTGGMLTWEQDGHPLEK